MTERSRSSPPSVSGVSTPVAAEGVTEEPAPPSKRKRPYDRSIVEGPLVPAVWKIAWPTMLTNVIGGL